MTLAKLAVAATALCLAAYAVPTNAQDFAPYYGHMMWGGGMMLAGSLWILTLVAVAVGAVMLLTRGAGGRGRGDALDILKSRFVRGEITKEEFEERRRVIAD